MKEKLKTLWKKAVAWNRSHKPLHWAYLICLLLLGISQGIISIIVLLLWPDRPVGSR